jgi:rubrerythrin
MMATTVGHESDVTKLVQDLLYLEHDAIAAYDSTIDKLESEAFKAQVAAFRNDHLAHISTLKAMASELGIEAPREGDMKRMLTTGKVAIASLMGDGAILKAMKTNEDDTVTAYDRARQHQDARPESVAFFQRALDDERRHRTWFEETAAAT